MEYITRNSSNTIRPTCQESESLTAPDYLIKFISVSTKDIRYCWCSDTSSYPDRYQELTFTETDTPVSGTATVKLDTKGVWNFYIYEYNGSAPVNETGLSEVEQGQITVNHPATVLNSYNGYQSTFKKYDG